MLAARWLFALAVQSLVAAQDRGAVALDQRVRNLTTTARVLLVGAHPDDEDTRLITWLSRARGVETAYLSLTRGESGANVAGHELGDGLGAVRTAEVLEARKIDGAMQYFTRAVDFGYSRTAEETLKHWPRDAMVGDLVTIIRSFRPHVIIARYTGTPDDGDGHHEASAILTRQAFESADDTVAFPIANHGFPWRPLTLYGPGTGLTIDVSGFDPVSGRTWLALAAESRAMHRTQGIPDSALRPRYDAERFVTLQRIASHVADSAGSEHTLFAGIDTSLARFAGAVPDTMLRILSTLSAHADSARAVLDLRQPDGALPHLARAARLAAIVRGRAPRCLHPAIDASQYSSTRLFCNQLNRQDLDAALDLIQRRASEATLIAAGFDLSLVADREDVAHGDSLPATLTVANHGRTPVQLVTVSVGGTVVPSNRLVTLAPDSTVSWTFPVEVLGSTAPWWFSQRLGQMHEPYASALDGLARPAAAPDRVTIPAVAIPENIRRVSDVTVLVRIAGQLLTVSVGSVTYRTADPLGGVQDRLVTGVPPITLGFDHSLEWVPLGKPVDRLLRFSIQSNTDSVRTVSLKLVAPEGMRVDSLPGYVTLRPRESRDLLLRVRGTMPAGRQPFGILAQDSSGFQFDRGVRWVRYPHLRPLQFTRGSALWLHGVEITVPSRLTVAYVQGVGDLVQGYLYQLGVRVTTIGYDELLNADLSRFTTVVVGPRAYEANPGLVAANDKLLDFARRGGTLLVLGGTAATYALDVFPYPVGAGPDGALDRVTLETAPVTVQEPAHRVLSWPNRLTEEDWTGWSSERGSFMPRQFDSRYAAPLSMQDPEQPEARGALLIAPLGRGTYIYTTLSLVQQIPAAVSGAARLLVNLMSAGLESSAPARDGRGR